MTKKIIVDNYMNEYILISSIIGAFIAFDMNYIPMIEDKIKSGEIGVDFSRPYSFLIYIFCHYLGKCAFKLAYSAIPLYVIISWIGVETKFEVGNVLCFGIALFFALVIFFLINAICGMLSFWFLSVGNLHIIIDSSITLFSGSIIPLWIIPENMKIIYDILPFKYLFYYPISICQGSIGVKTVIEIWKNQVLWIAVLVIMATFVYRFGKKKLQVFGG